MSFDKGKATTHTILTQRKVDIGGSDTAAYLDTDQGKKVMLIQWRGPSTGWWSRAYDAR